jgi:hypothetical protein
MDDYLAKPVRAAELFATIDRVISARAVSPPIAGEDAGRTSLIDPTRLLATCGGDADGLRELCQDFRVYTPSRMAEVAAALRDGDAPRLSEAAHKLCALLGAFSAAAGDEASGLEDLAAHGQLDDARPRVQRLETMAEELTRELDGVSLEILRRQAGVAEEPG